MAVLDFDGTNDRLGLGSSGLLRNVGGATLYLVAKPDYISVLRTLVQISSNNSAWSRISTRITSSAKAEVGGRRLDTDSFAFVAGTGNVPTATFSVLTGIWDYANSDVFIYLGQSLDASSTSFQTDGNTSNTDSAAARIGVNLHYQNFFDGKFAELILFAEAHPAVMRTLIWAYLNRKWGLS